MFNALCGILFLPSPLLLLLFVNFLVFFSLDLRRTENLVTLTFALTFSRCIVCYSILFFGELHMHGIELGVQWGTVELNIANSCCLGMLWKYSKDSEKTKDCHLFVQSAYISLAYASITSVTKLYHNEVLSTHSTCHIRSDCWWIWTLQATESESQCYIWCTTVSGYAYWAGDCGEEVLVSACGYQGLQVPTEGGIASPYSLSVTWYNPSYFYVYRAGSVALHRLSSQIRYAMATGAMRCSRLADHSQPLPRYVSRVSATRDSVSLWIFMAFKLTNTV